MTTIPTNLQAVQMQIAKACATAHRDPASVTLLAVSKTQSPSALREAYQAGQTAFGENYIQEALEKIAALRDLPLQWHCIGPIQSNKTKPVAEQFDWVHSIDRLKIAQRLSEQRPADLPPLQVCLQINIDGGDTKSGMTPHDALTLALAVAALPRLTLRGLMTIPEPAFEFEAQLVLHKRAVALFDQIKAALAALPALNTLNYHAEKFDTLSMGMSADLDAAIQAGSTLVRVGTAIFGGRSKTP